MTAALSRHPLAGSTPGPGTAVAETVPEDHPLPRQKDIGEFSAGPDLVDVAVPMMRFLQRWQIRPLSLWQAQLESQSWPGWFAAFIIRFATFCWFLAGATAIAGSVLAMTWVTGMLLW